MFSEQTTPIKPYDIPINSEFYGEGPLEVRFPKFFHFLNIVIPGIDWAVSSIIYRGDNTKGDLRVQDALEKFQTETETQRCASSRTRLRLRLKIDLFRDQD